MMNEHMKRQEDTAGRISGLPSRVTIDFRHEDHHPLAISTAAASPVPAHFSDSGLPSLTFDGRLSIGSL